MSEAYRVRSDGFRVPMAVDREAREPAKPKPPKPISIIAQVEASGTPETVILAPSSEAASQESLSNWN